MVLTPSMRDWFFLILSAIALSSGRIFLGILFLNIFVLSILQDRGYLEKWNATKVLGFILMLRTSKGQKILEKISRPRKFWRGFGEFSIWICLIMLFFTTLIVILSFISIFTSTRDQISIEPGEVLLIPGVSTGIPIFWPIIALIVALIIHEYGHGILMRAHGMRVRSFGLLIFSFIPMGAFAEPEYREVLKAPKRERMRIYAAGPTVNLVFSFILILILAIGISGINSTMQGAYSAAIVVDGPADEGGLEPYDLIIEVNNQSIRNGNDLREILNSSRAGDVLIVKILPFDGKEWGGEQTIQITLGDRYEQYRSQNISENDLERAGINQGDAFLGVQGDSLGPTIRDTEQGKNRLMGPFNPDLTTGQRVISTIIYPIEMLSIPFQLNGEIMTLEEQKMLDFSIIEFFIIEGLFWFFWINFLLGFANLIPVVPFDGGHIMRDLINSIINWTAEKGGLIHSQKAEIIATKTSNIASLLFFIIFLIPILYGLII